MNKLYKNIFYRFLVAHVEKYPTPKNLSYFWSFGSVAGLLLVLQILTGLILASYYVPTAEGAFWSVEYVMREVKNGWLIRYLHSNGASMFFIVTYLHIARGLYFKSYMFPRVMVWYTGLIIFILMMATAFLGYVLPYGQMSFWGATVITNFFTAIPYIGPSIAQWLWGGYSVGNATLGRFFVLHFLLPFIITLFVVLHIIILHAEGGSSNPLGISNPEMVNFYPFFFYKDLIAFLVMLWFLTILIVWYPNLLSHPDNYIPANPLITPRHIVPEWYFLPFYAMLRAIPNKLLGILTMAASILILFLLPFIETTRIQAARYKPIFKFFFSIHMSTISLLFWLGSRPIEYPFYELSQFFTFYYFFSFLFILPYVGTLESLIYEESEHVLKTLPKQKHLY